LNFVLSRIFGEPINKIRNSIFNKNGNELYIEYSSGFWRKSEYDNNGNEIYNEDSKGFWRKYEYDDNGKVIYYEDSDGYWEKSEYDDNGNIIYWENFKGDWIKREYDDNDNRIYYEDSNGYIEGDRWKMKKIISFWRKNKNQRWPLLLWRGFLLSLIYFCIFVLLLI